MKRSTHLAIYGDAGRGNDEQFALGQAMAQRHAIEPYDFALSTGDNQYDATVPGIMQTIFEQPFAALIAAGVPFYQTIGNHDMDEGRIEDQFAYSRTVDALAQRRGGWVLPAENYVIRSPHLRVIVLNVTEAASEFIYPEAALAFAAEELEQASDDWTVLCFHYHLWSTGYRGDHEEMKEALLPFLDRYPVDFVLAGHEHHAEIFAPWKGMRFAIVGNGSEIREHVMPSDQACQFRTDAIGFAELTVERHRARFAFVAAKDARVLWEETLSRRGR